MGDCQGISVCPVIGVKPTVQDCLNCPKADGCYLDGAEDTKDKRFEDG